MFKKAISILMVISMALAAVSCGAKPTELTVLAAASLADAMDEIIAQYQDENKVKITVSYGASGTLQQQIEQGAPADLFISAGQKQMDALKDAGLLADSGAKPLLQNRLALIVPKDAAPIKDFAELENVGKIAVGDAKSVPAGKYAQEAFEKLGLSDKINDKLVFAKDVREVLSWVEAGNADAGLVYETDALISDKVQLCAFAPEGSHKPIKYPLSVIKASKEPKAAESFAAYLQGDKAKEIFVKYGFTMAE
ncbi:MAG: molybdate ABC transporter substrate-binding protein [Oscillospiraceae bacterium]